jgi:hypothetical protein
MYILIIFFADNRTPFLNLIKQEEFLSSTQRERRLRETAGRYLCYLPGKGGRVITVYTKGFSFYTFIITALYHIGTTPGSSFLSREKTYT